MSDLPYRVATAVARALTVNELNAQCRLTLAHIVMLLGKRGDGEVFAWRSTLSVRSGLSVRSLYRYLDLLEKSGFITRTYKPRLVGSESPITMTARGIALLYEEGGSKSQEENKPVSAVAKLAVVNKLSPTGLAFKEQSFAVAQNGFKSSGVSPGSKPPTGFVKVLGFTLPAELQFLVDYHQMLPASVCKLMRWAKNTGATLSEIVHWGADKIRFAKGRQAFQALSFLVKEYRLYREGKSRPAPLDSTISTQQTVSQALAKSHSDDRLASIRQGSFDRFKQSVDQAIIDAGAALIAKIAAKTFC